MEVISIALSCIGFLVGYILATRSTEKQIIKYIKGITFNEAEDVPPEWNKLIGIGSASFQKYLLSKLQNKAHRKA